MTQKHACHRAILTHHNHLAIYVQGKEDLKKKKNHCSIIIKQQNASGITMVADEEINRLSMASIIS